MGENTTVVVYATYREIILNSEQIFESLKNKIKQFDTIEQISYCSFLNMICHTCYIDELLNYRLVISAEESFSQDTLEEFITPKDKVSKTIEREFWVDNLIPMTDVYIDTPCFFILLTMHFLIS